jgi:CRISPR-associated protein Csb2
MLILDIEWLLGVCFAARSPADATPDWPPQPDRIFSALVASWGARGEHPEERAALEWLEGQAAPEIAAADHKTRTSATAYVPPNDPTVGDIRILPARRRRQPRQFPATPLHGDPGEPHLRLTWQADAPPDLLDALRALAHDTSYIGHSSSLVRCIFLEETPCPAPGLAPAATSAAPYAGRLDELESLHARHLATADPTARPRPASLIEPQPIVTLPIRTSIFGARWIVLECVDQSRPDLRATAVIGRGMRDALMSAWPDPIPEWLSGHTSDGTPSRDPHLAVVPLGDVGFGHSESARQCCLGLALVLPRAIEAAWVGSDTPEAHANSRMLQAALHRLMHPGPAGDLLVLRLGKVGEVLLRPVAVPEAGKHSLRPARYTEARRIWSTVTPIALDRHTKTEQPRDEAAEIVADSCARIELPRPVAVHVHKHAAIAGVPSAWPAGGAPQWTGWARPAALAHRQLTHATLHFADKVAGPVILGAGRFFGLGLCLPVNERDQP